MILTASSTTLVIGTLKGYDQLMNLVLDEVKEAMTGKTILHIHNILLSIA